MFGPDNLHADGLFRPGYQTKAAKVISVIEDEEP
jgi:hypothetical protein